jgi:hypothetical protein
MPAATNITVRTRAEAIQLLHDFDEFLRHAMAALDPQVVVEKEQGKGVMADYDKVSGYVTLTPAYLAAINSAFGFSDVVLASQGTPPAGMQASLGKASFVRGQIADAIRKLSSKRKPPAVAVGLGIALISAVVSFAVTWTRQDTPS